MNTRKTNKTGAPPGALTTIQLDHRQVRIRSSTPALAWSEKLSVEVGGAGTVAQAGVVLPRLLADRLGLCTALAGALSTW